MKPRFTFPFSKKDQLRNPVLVFQRTLYRIKSISKLTDLLCDHLHPFIPQSLLRNAT